VTRAEAEAQAVEAAATQRASIDNGVTSNLQIDSSVAAPSSRLQSCHAADLQWGSSESTPQSITPDTSVAGSAGPRPVEEQHHRCRKLIQFRLDHAKGIEDRNTKAEKLKLKKVMKEKVACNKDMAAAKTSVKGKKRKSK